MELNNYILQKATQAGICKEWAAKITEAKSVDDLLKMYVDGIDFCIKENFPSNTDLKRLGGSQLGHHGIYIDSELTSQDAPFTVLLGKCQATVAVQDYASSQLFVKHSSAANVQVAGNAFMIIDCFDNSEVNVRASGNCKVLINIYGHAKVAHTSQDKAVIKIVHKNKITY